MAKETYIDFQPDSNILNTLLIKKIGMESKYLKAKQEYIQYKYTKSHSCYLVALKTPKYLAALVTAFGYSNAHIDK
jgi:hypothetical protein